MRVESNSFRSWVYTAKDQKIEKSIQLMDKSTLRELGKSLLATLYLYSGAFVQILLRRKLLNASFLPRQRQCQALKKQTVT